jgi:hypothetical protein
MNEDTTQNTTVTDEQLAAAKGEIETILQKYNIILVPVVMHHGDRTISRIDITPAQKQADLNTNSAPVS